MAWQMAWRGKSPDQRSYCSLLVFFARAPPLSLAAFPLAARRSPLAARRSPLAARRTPLAARPSRLPSFLVLAFYRVSKEK